MTDSDHKESAGTRKIVLLATVLMVLFWISFAMSSSTQSTDHGQSADLHASLFGIHNTTTRRTGDGAATSSQRSEEINAALPISTAEEVQGVKRRFPPSTRFSPSFQEDEGCRTILKPSFRSVQGVDGYETLTASKKGPQLEKVVSQVKGLPSDAKWTVLPEALLRTMSVVADLESRSELVDWKNRSVFQQVERQRFRGGADEEADIDDPPPSCAHRQRPPGERSLPLFPYHHLLVALDPPRNDTVPPNKVSAADEARMRAKEARLDLIRTFENDFKISLMKELGHTTHGAVYPSGYDPAALTLLTPPTTSLEEEEILPEPSPPATTTPAPKNEPTTVSPVDFEEGNVTQAPKSKKRTPPPLRAARLLVKPTWESDALVNALSTPSWIRTVNATWFYEDRVAATLEAVRPPPPTRKKGKTKKAPPEILGGHLPYTEFAQKKIWLSQQPQAGKQCTKSKIFLAKMTDAGGLMSSIILLNWQLAHAMVMNRRLVVHWQMKPWSSTPSCVSKGWECYFIPPSPCSFSDSGAKKDRWSPKSPNEYVMNSKARVLVSPFLNFYDLPFDSLPDLQPENVTREQVEQKSGMTYSTWAQRQLLKYLMRGLQPWAEVMILKEMQTKAGYPWREEDFMIAAHVRNGQVRKDEEMKGIMGCRRFDHSLQYYMIESLVQSLAKDLAATNREAKIFFSFDDPAALTNAKKFWQQVESGKCTSLNILGVDNATATLADLSVNATASVGFPRPPLPIVSCNYSNVPKAVYVPGRDSKLDLAHLFGFGHLVKVSLVNFYLAVGSDAWVNNKASHWNQGIHIMKDMLGGGRFDWPYLDMVTMVQDPQVRYKVLRFCRVRRNDGVYDWDIDRRVKRSGFTTRLLKKRATRRSSDCTKLLSAMEDEELL